ncbi:MAG: hypothetical protein ACI8XB_001870 [Patiriisocius sp.]|jgi:hypothetical protein
MAYLQKISTVIFIVLLLPFAGAIAQEDNSEISIERKEIKSIKWNDITEGTQFIEKSEDTKKESLDYVRPNISTPMNFTGLRTLVIVLLVASLLVILILIVKNHSSNLKVKNDLEHSIQQAEMNIDKSDLYYILQEALDQKKYKLALRIYYLIIIKELNILGSIKYKKDKTNYAYLMEMRTNLHFKEFKKMTKIYEFFWYGDKDLDHVKFEPITTLMDQFVKTIKSEQKAVE